MRQMWGGTRNSTDPLSWGDRLGFRKAEVAGICATDTEEGRAREKSILEISRGRLFSLWLKSSHTSTGWSSGKCKEGQRWGQCQTRAPAWPQLLAALMAGGAGPHQA